MRPENFIGFFTAVGFFVGLFLCILADLNANELMLYPLIITLGFFLVAHISIMNFIDASKDSKIYFDKYKYEEINDYLIDNLTDRERKMDAIIQIQREKIFTKSRKVKKQEDERAKTKAA